MLALLVAAHQPNATAFTLRGWILDTRAGAYSAFGQRSEL